MGDWGVGEGFGTVTFFVTAAVVVGTFRGLDVVLGIVGILTRVRGLIVVASTMSVAFKVALVASVVVVDVVRGRGVVGGAGVAVRAVRTPLSPWRTSPRVRLWIWSHSLRLRFPETCLMRRMSSLGVATFSVAESCAPRRRLCDGGLRFGLLGESSWSFGRKDFRKRGPSFSSVAFCEKKTALVWRN